MEMDKFGDVIINKNWNRGTNATWAGPQRESGNLVWQKKQKFLCGLHSYVH